jgi:hypothetical protein
MECIRYARAEAPQPLGLCAACAASVRAEVVDDLKRIDTYLSSWAAFDEWLRLRDAA